ncbi:MAG: preprotein translocase subunit SecE [Ruminococcus sp.]|nr:preprotein translocase subunit SecE [Ruminococcus sp.]MCM1381252.1 preprotein translocase subunit SecE [Muribaculaceae bacterium]MCM1478637.1 preprotein translocase subunit SecE [Muribaculaceae bacterium]
MADTKKKKSSIVAQAEAKANKIVNDREKAKAKGKSGKKQNGVVKYFKDLKSEIKKVTWPSWRKVVNNTAVVLVGMCVSAVVVWGIDSILTALLSLTAK